MAKRIGANKQLKINKRNNAIKEFFNSKGVRYIGYTVMSIITLSTVYIMMVIAFILDQS